MHELTRTLPCPRCGADATVTVVDGLGDGYGVAADRAVAFRCVDATHTLSLTAALRLWADDRLCDFAGGCPAPRPRQDRALRSSVRT